MHDPSTKEPVKGPVIRRFGYRLDSIKTTATDPTGPYYSTQAAEMEGIENSPATCANFLDDLARNARLQLLGKTILSSKAALTRGLKIGPSSSVRGTRPWPTKASSFLKDPQQNDVTAARQHLSYDYFQRGLADQQRERDEISGVFNEIIQNIPQGK